MPPWTITVSSAIGAIVVVGALAVSEVINAPRSEIGTILLPHSPGGMSDIAEQLRTAIITANEATGRATPQPRS